MSSDKPFLVMFWRWYLPVALCVAGTIMLVIDGADVFGVDAFAAFVGAGLSVSLTNVLWRIGIAGNRDRDDEEEARRYLAEHGRWPEDGPRGPTGPSAPQAPVPAPVVPAPTDGAGARREWARRHPGS